MFPTTPALDEAPMPAVLPLASLLLLAACGSPSEYYGEPTGPGPGSSPAAGQVGDADVPAADGAGDGAQRPAVVEDFEDSEWADLHCIPTPLALESSGLERGKGVIVSGVIESEAPTEGRATMIDVVTEPDEHGISRNMMNTSCRSTGAFSMELPKDLGPVRLVAFLSSPGLANSEAPAGITEEAAVTIGKDPVEGVTVVIREGTDLGPYAPWRTLPAGENPESALEQPPLDEDADPGLEAGDPPPVEGVDVDGQPAPDVAGGVPAEGVEPTELAP
jgi:hypothetical protein